MSGADGPTAPVRSDAPARATDRWAALGAASRVWIHAYRVEIALFAFCLVAFASFSSQRFLRQSAAPHFVYQAQAWLEGRLDIDPEVLPNYEDWACVREIGAAKVRCVGRIEP